MEFTNSTHYGGNMKIQNKKNSRIFYNLNLLIALAIFLNFIPAIAETNQRPLIAKRINQIYASKSINNLIGHYNNEIKIVFSDIDGTLIESERSSKPKASQDLKQSIQKLKDSQIPLILVTGRSGWEAQQYAKIMGAEKAYIIAQQGAEIINPDGKTIYENNIKGKDVKRLVNDVKKFNKEHYQNSKVMFLVNGEYYSKDGTIFPHHWQTINSFKSFRRFKSNFSSAKIVLYEPNSRKIKLIQNDLQKKFPNLNIYKVSYCYLDITNASATKANAIKKLSEILNVDLKNAATFGDSENDISMLNLIKTNGGLAVAVGNAMPSVKDSANFVTAPVNDNGFSKAVDKILLNNSIVK